MNLRNLSLLLTLLLAGLLVPGCGGNKMPMPKELGAPQMTPEEMRLAEAEVSHGAYYSHHLADFIADNPTRKSGGTVLLGDSVVERFPTNVVFPDGSVINRGIGGDRVSGVADRLDISVAPLRPSRVCVLVGINDILWPKFTEEETMRQYDELLSDIQKAAPQAEVVAASILPVGASRAVVIPKIRKMNEAIEASAHSHGAAYVNLYDALADENGAYYPELTTDGVHLSLEGYEAVLQQVLPPEEFVAAAIALYPKWKDDYQAARKADRIDPPVEGEFPGNRGPDQLVVYTPAYGAESTRTNEWGTEVIIVDGTVDRFPDGGDSTIPPNGMVISGHGVAASWILSSLKKGMHVELTNGVVHLAPPSGPNIPLRDKLNAARREKLGEIEDLMAANASEAKLAAARKELLSIYAQRSALNQSTR